MGKKGKGLANYFIWALGLHLAHKLLGSKGYVLLRAAKSPEYLARYIIRRMVKKL